MKSNHALSYFWANFGYRDFVAFEKYILGVLDWNLNQMTPYHFLQALISQGIVLSHEKVKVEKTKQDKEFQSRK